MSDSLADEGRLLNCEGLKVPNEVQHIDHHNDDENNQRKREDNVESIIQRQSELNYNGRGLKWRHKGIDHGDTPL